MGTKLSLGRCRSSGMLLHNKEIMIMFYAFFKSQKKGF
jgi:hypothetical protein